MVLPAIELNGKELFAFLNGICKAKFDGDTEYSALFLRDNIFPEDYDVVKVSELMQVYGKMLDFAAEHSLDSKEFTDYIELQGVTTEDHVNAWNKIWKTEAPKIKAKLVLQTRKMPTLDRVSWRVDVLSASSTSSVLDDSISEPVALVEIQTKQPSSTGTELDSIFFEMDKESLNTILSTLEDVNKTIEKFM